MQGQREAADAAVAELQLGLESVREDVRVSAQADAALQARVTKLREEVVQLVTAETGARGDSVATLRAALEGGLKAGRAEVDKVASSVQVRGGPVLCCGAARVWALAWGAAARCACRCKATRLRPWTSAARQQSVRSARRRSGSQRWRLGQVRPRRWRLLRRERSENAWRRCKSRHGLASRRKVPVQTCLLSLPITHNSAHMSTLQQTWLQNALSLTRRALQIRWPSCKRTKRERRSSSSCMRRLRHVHKRRRAPLRPPPCRRSAQAWAALRRRWRSRRRRARRTWSRRLSAPLMHKAPRMLRGASPRQCNVDWFAQHVCHIDS